MLEHTSKARRSSAHAKQADDGGCTVVSSTRMLGSFRSVAMTTPLVALMPSEVAPALTALSAYSIWTSLPLGLKVVRENEYYDGTRTQAVSRPNHDVAESSMKTAVEEGPGQRGGGGGVSIAKEHYAASTYLRFPHDTGTTGLRWASSPLRCPG